MGSSEEELFEQACLKIREPKAKGGIVMRPEVVARRLRALGYPVEEYTIDEDGYRRFVRDARYAEEFPSYYPHHLPQKSLEHYVASQLLGLKPGELYVDIASAASPVPAIYARLLGVRAFRQDLAYPHGVHGDMIGGDAAELPLPYVSVPAMALHCSFEHFEGDSDIGFIREAARVLTPGSGRLCIVPMYFAEDYSILTDPVIAVSDRFVFEKEAVVNCQEGYRNRHGRYYDPEQCARRIGENLSGLRLRLFRMTNITQVVPGGYLFFAALFEKPAPAAGIGARMRRMAGWFSGRGRTGEPTTLKL